MEEKNSKINYSLYAIILVVILIIATISVSYAYYSVSTSYDNTIANGSLALDCVDMTLSNNNTTLGLSYNYPITDELAMQSGSVTPLRVTVTNNCSNQIKYTLALSTLALTTNQTNYIEDNKIRYKILKNNSNHKGIGYLSNIPKIATNSKLYSDLTGTDGELSTKYPNYTLKQIYSVDDVATLNSNTSATYEFYMWVDYYEGDSAMYGSNNAVHDESFDGTTEGKKFAAAISLTFNDGTANEATPLGQYIIDNSISGLEKTFVGDETNGYDTLYRFSGTSGNTGINNYICLGTTSICESGSEEMYRIIGVEPDTGYVKVIKQTKYGENILWNSSAGVTWPESDAYDAMETWYNSVSFKSMIVSHSWNIGDVGELSDTYIGTRSTVMSYEDNTTTTAYVGMLALSDYYLAYRGDQNWYNSYSNYTSNWIHLANNGNTNVNEWTMSRYDSNDAWFVGFNGVVFTPDMNLRSLAVRPVFYLNSTVNRTSGSGTSDDPFIVG